MISGIILVASTALIAALLHRRSRFEKKIYKDVPLVEWINVLVIPLLYYFGWAMMVRNIINRPAINIFPIEDFELIIISVLFIIYGFIGNAIHFTGKILWRYLVISKHSMAYRVNEMFHGRLSHYLVFLDGMLVAFLLPFLEINHPLQYDVDRITFYTIIFSGVIFGISSSKGIFFSNQWFGGYKKPLFFIAFIILTVLTQMIKILKLKLIVYPLVTFIFIVYLSFICTFILRQFLIFTRLGNKRRLKFLAKILSA